MADLLSIPAPDGRTFHTAAGFALHHLGKLPSVGESFDAHGWRFEVIDVDGRRVDKLLASRLMRGQRRAAI
jgi:putative hemolysin